MKWKVHFFIEDYEFELSLVLNRSIGFLKLARLKTVATFGDML